MWLLLLLLILIPLPLLHLHLHLLLHLRRRRRRRHDVPAGPLPLIVGLPIDPTVHHPLGTNQRPYRGIHTDPGPPLGHLPRPALDVEQMGYVSPQHGAVGGMDLNDAMADGDGMVGRGGMQQYFDSRWGICRQGGDRCRFHQDDGMLLLVVELLCMWLRI